MKFSCVTMLLSLKIMIYPRMDPHRYHREVMDWNELVAVNYQPTNNALFFRIDLFHRTGLCYQLQLMERNLYVLL